MVKVSMGDLFESKAQALVNTVNCVGVMGKGIALEFKKRFPVKEQSTEEEPADSEEAGEIPELDDLDYDTVEEEPAPEKKTENDVQPEDSAEAAISPPSEPQVESDEVDDEEEAPDTPVDDEKENK